MATTQDDIREWLKSAEKEGATHMMVVVDTFDHEDYPVNVKPGEDVNKVFADHSANMQRVMEVYALHLDWEKQLSEHRSFHFENPPPKKEPKKPVPKKKTKRK